MAGKDDQEAKKRELFAKYLAEQRIFIVDSSSASRARLGKTMVDLGAKSNRINLFSDYESAETALAEIKPKVILTDYYLGARSGFDLIEQMKKMQAPAKDCFAILVTGNSAQSTVARAAEEDVDTFILKPYTVEIFEKTVLSAAMAKLNPNAYLKTIEEGKDLMLSGKPDQAMELFKKAKEMDPKPTLACFYLGQAELMKQAMEQAADDYKEGLGYNKIHFKCLVGLFDLLMGQKRHNEAYDIVKRIAQYFPANPKRLASVLRLAIATSNFADIEGYYRIFTGLDKRTDELVRYICSALIVTGKHYLRTNARSRALELFENVGISAAGRTQYYRLCIETLLEFDMVKESENFLKRFPADDQKKPDYLISKYLVSDRQVPSTMSVTMGRDVLKQNVKHPKVYLTLIGRLIENKKKDQAEELIALGSKEFPDMATDFQAMHSKLAEAAAT